MITRRHRPELTPTLQVFNISKTSAVAEVTVQPGAIREMHWHPNADEWNFFIRGKARITIFAAEGTARTFDYVPGDVGIVPRNMGHFVENIGDEPVEMLEVFRADEFRGRSAFTNVAQAAQAFARAAIGDDRIDTLLPLGEERLGDTWTVRLAREGEPVTVALRETRSEPLLSTCDATRPASVREFGLISVG